MCVILAETPAIVFECGYRASDPKERKKYVALVEDVQQKGGEVLRFSSMHESGQRKLSFPSVPRTVIYPFSRAKSAHRNSCDIDFPLGC